MDFCQLSKTLHPLFLTDNINTNQNQIKNIHLPDILFQVLKVLLIKYYKIQLPVLLFLVVLHQPLHQEISFFTTFENFIQHYLKKDFHQKILFYNGFTQTTHLTAKIC